MLNYFLALQGCHKNIYCDMTGQSSCQYSVCIYDSAITHNCPWWHVYVYMLHTWSSSDVGMASNQLFNTLRRRQKGRHFPDIWIAFSSMKLSLKFVHKVGINNIPGLVQIMAWHRPGDKPLSEPVIVSLLMHICVTRPQWVKINRNIWWLATLVPETGILCCDKWLHPTVYCGM